MIVVDCCKCGGELNELGGAVNQSPRSRQHVEHQ